MECSTCKKIVTEKDCTFGGLHNQDDCYGRVFFDNGREYFGSMNHVSREERADNERSETL